MRSFQPFCGILGRKTSGIIKEKIERIELLDNAKCPLEVQQKCRVDQWLHIAYCLIKLLMKMKVASLS